MRTLRLTAALAAALLCAAVAVAAPPAPDPGSEGWNKGQAYDRLYDPSREIVARATVINIEHFVPRPGMAEGVRAFVAAGPESVWVHLGPAEWVEGQDLRLAAGDVIVMTGAHLMFDGAPFVMASRIERDGRVLRLRDSQGRPAWTGARRRPPA